MTIRIIENALIARIAARKLRTSQMAVTIGRHIYLYNISSSHFLLNAQWLRHELTHVRQAQKYGVSLFLILYLWESLRHGYHNNRFEKEARAAEQMDTDLSHIHWR